MLLAIIGVVGYALSSMGRNEGTQQEYQRHTYEEDASVRSGGWFGGDRSYRPSYSSPVRYEKDHTSDFGMHISTGFGSTKRR
jgi:hypothetical protein